MSIYHVQSQKPQYMLSFVVVVSQVTQGKSECIVIELTTSCKYKTLYGKL